MIDSPHDTGAKRRVFLVEAYAPGHDVGHFRRRTAFVPGEVEILHAAYVPTDDTAYWLVRADTGEQVDAAWRAAGCPLDRVLAAVLIDRPVHPLDRRDQP